MTIELHHVFVLTEPGAPEADRLSGIGLIEGDRNTHPGQGTANRRFFFPNTVLELLYVCDVQEAVNGPGRRLRIADRAADRLASPFGLIVSATPGATGVPFGSWRYCPDYFAADQCFYVGENSDRLEEPLCICMPLNLPRPDAQTQRSNPNLSLTGLRISVPVSQPSPTLEAFANCQHISLRLNKPHLLELIFNEAREGFYRDLTPALPLVVRW